MITLSCFQLQAIVCGLVASFFALGMNFINTGEWPLDHVVLLTSASILTASMVSVVLGSVMVVVILLSRRYKVNPDNIATPVAGSLGDVVTLYMLSSFSSFIWNYIKGWLKVEIKWQLKLLNCKQEFVVKLLIFYVKLQRGTSGLHTLSMVFI